jgi:molybdate transport system ATP-binding protein
MTTSVGETAAQLEMPLVDGRVGDAVRIAIRAGDILLAVQRPVGLSARNIAAGRIVSMKRTGAWVAVFVSIGPMLEAHVTPSACEDLGLREGRDVWLVIKTHSVRAIAAV